MIRKNKLQVADINEKFSSKVNNDFEDYEIPILGAKRKTIPSSPEIEWTKSATESPEL